jgi:hypothetical protein
MFLRRNNLIFKNRETVITKMFHVKQSVKQSVKHCETIRKNVSRETIRETL